MMVLYACANFEIILNVGDNYAKQLKYLGSIVGHYRSTIEQSQLNS